MQAEASTTGDHDGAIVKRIMRLGKAFGKAGQAVGIKEVDNGIWLVSFREYDLGYIDLEERTLQPLPNPFGGSKV